MNPNTNELWSFKDFKESNFINRDELAKEELSKQGFKEVPDELQKDAEKLLNGKPKTIVPKGHKLDKWAEQFRKKKKKKKRSITKASRRNNR